MAFSLPVHFLDFDGKTWHAIYLLRPFSGGYFPEMKRKVCDRLGVAEVNMSWEKSSGDYKMSSPIGCVKDLDDAISYALKRAEKMEKAPWMEIVVERCEHSGKKNSKIRHVRRPITNQQDRAPLFHEGIKCDGCGMVNFPGLRYECKRCFEFDLCYACYKSDRFDQDPNFKHARKHPMHRIELSYYNDSSPAIKRCYRTVVPCEYCDEKGFLTADYAEHVKKCHKAKKDVDIDLDPSFKSMLTELWFDLKEQKAELAGREKAFEETKKSVDQKEMQMRALETSVFLEKRHALLIAADNKSKENALKEWEELLNGRDERLKGREATVAAREAAVDEKEGQLKTLKDELEMEKQRNVEKESSLNGYESEVKEREEWAKDLMEDVTARKAAVDEEEKDSEERKRAIDERERLVKEREDAVTIDNALPCATYEKAKTMETALKCWQSNLEEREAAVKAREEAATLREKALAVREALVETREEASRPPSKWNHGANGFAQVSELHFSYPLGERNFWDDIMPSAISPLAVRADRPCPLTSAIFYFEVRINLCDGMMGIGFTKSSNYSRRLPGWDAESYGYHGDDGHFYWLPEGQGSSPGVEYGPTYGTGDVIGCGLNVLEKTIFFTKNGVNLGNAFTIVEPLDGFYPMVGLMMRGAVVEANFGQRPFLYDIAKDIKAVETLKDDMKSEKDACTESADVDEVVSEKEAHEVEEREEDDVVDTVEEQNDADYDSDASYENIDMDYGPGDENE